MRFIVQRKRRGPSVTFIALSAFVAGAAAGSVAALLMAPANGEETRRYIKRRGRELAKEAATRGAEWQKRVDRVTSTTAANLRQAGDGMASRVMDALDGASVSISR
jgi:gas vesicle protein